MLGGALLLALLSPSLLAALPGATRLAPRGAPGGDCCVSMPCCPSGGSCATGSCKEPKASAIASRAPSETAPRLAAGCPGPAPAVQAAADRDPMVPAAQAATPSPHPRVTAISAFAWSASERADDPAVPPPRV